MQKQRRTLASGLVVAIAASLLLLTASPALALTVDVRFTLTDLDALDSFEEPGDADFYAIVTIDGTERVSNPCAPGFEDNDHPLDGPASLEFKKEGIDLSVGTIAIKVEVWDDDDPCPDDFINWGSLRGSDDLGDITPNPPREMNLTLNLGACTFTGDVTNVCGVEAQSAGTSGDDNASIVFKIDVDEPPSAPGMNIRCWHTPAAPQPGQTVTIKVEYLDGNLQPDLKIADNLQVFLGFNKATPAGEALGSDEFTFVTPPVAAPNFTYACRLIDDGTPIWTGWRTVNVGPAPEPNGPLPIMVTGPQLSRIDVVFIPDMDNYSGPADPNFQSDISTLVQAAYFAVGDATSDAAFLLTNQDTFNFWLAGTTGDAEASGSTCPHVAPPNWYTAHAFADVGAIIHTDTFRDCAPSGERLFSSEQTSTQTFRHEQGHRPFGLADEYCGSSGSMPRPGTPAGITNCDGGYFQADPFPNVYVPGALCEAEAVAFGRPASACQTWISTRSGGGTWETHEPPGGDLMVDNTTAQALDLRRINWILDVKCASGDC